MKDDNDVYDNAPDTMIEEEFAHHKNIAHRDSSRRGGPNGDLNGDGGGGGEDVRRRRWRNANKAADGWSRNAGQGASAPTRSAETSFKGGAMALYAKRKD